MAQAFDANGDRSLQAIRHLANIATSLGDHIGNIG
jgi:hypothetical protein